MGPAGFTKERFAAESRAPPPLAPGPNSAGSTRNSSRQRLTPDLPPSSSSSPHSRLPFRSDKSPPAGREGAVRHGKREFADRAPRLCRHCRSNHPEPSSSRRTTCLWTNMTNIQMKRQTSSSYPALAPMNPTRSPLQLTVCLAFFLPLAPGNSQISSGTMAIDQRLMLPVQSLYQIWPSLPIENFFFSFFFLCFMSPFRREAEC